MSKIFIISDTHFNHRNIIHYCDRPFTNTSEMNETLISNWNSIVKDEDFVFHLGDVGLPNKPGDEWNSLEHIFSRLKGNKILILGNHDRKSAAYYKSLGFSKVYQGHLKINEELWLSHMPLNNLKPNVINIHGHIHDQVLELSSKYINVSVEVINYTPIELSTLLKGETK